MKKGIIIGLVVIGFALVVLILLMGTSQYEVEYLPVLGGFYSDGFLKVIVKGPPENLYVTVTNPEGTVVGEKYISKEELLDGNETVVVRMSKVRTLPKSGTYTVIVKEALSNKIVYTTKPTFKGVKLKITDVEYERIEWKYSNLAVTLRIKNEGDLPVRYRAIVRVNGKKDEFYPRSTLCILPGEKKGLKDFLYIPLEEGVHTAVVELYGDDKKELLTSFTSEFTY